MEGPPLGPGGEDITWPDQVAPRGRKASSTRKIKPQTRGCNGVRLMHSTVKFIKNCSWECLARFWRDSRLDELGFGHT